MGYQGTVRGGTKEVPGRYQYQGGSGTRGVRGGYVGSTRRLPGGPSGTRSTLGVSTERPRVREGGTRGTMRGTMRGAIPRGIQLVGSPVGVANNVVVISSYPRQKTRFVVRSGKLDLRSNRICAPKIDKVPVPVTRIEVKVQVYQIIYI